MPGIFFLSIFRILTILAASPLYSLEIRPPEYEQPTATPQPDAHVTPVPLPAPSPGPETSQVPPITTQIYKVVFSTETLSEAVLKILQDASLREVENLSEGTVDISLMLGDLLRPPESGHFSAVASTGLRTAAAFAPVLFSLRLVAYHWRKLTGEEDGLMAVIGDWVVAGFSAAAAGPFLDLVVQTGWWAAGAALGETAQLARDFLSLSLVANLIKTLPLLGRPSMFGAVFAVAGGLGGLVGLVGLVFAFAVAQAVLFVLGVMAPVIAVLSVLPQMRWMRALWIKTVVVLALIPIAAGGVFKAATVLAVSFGGIGMAELLVRLCWLWGAAGFLLSMAGVLGKFTLSAAVEGAGKLKAGVRSMIAVGTAAAGGGAGMPAISSAFPMVLGNSSGGQSPTYIPAPVQGDQRAILQAFHISPGAGDFQRGFSALSPYFSAAGLDPQWVKTQYPEETERIVGVYLRNQEQIDLAADPLMEAARLSDSEGLMKWLDQDGSRL